MGVEAGKFPDAHGLASWAYTSANKRPCLTLQQDAGPDTHESYPALLWRDGPIPPSSGAWENWP